MTTKPTTPTTEQQEEEVRRLVDPSIVKYERAPNGRVFVTVSEETLIDRIVTALATRDAAARVEEREACAKVAEGYEPDFAETELPDWELTATAIAYDIRARSNSATEGEKP